MGALEIIKVLPAIRKCHAALPSHDCILSTWQPIHIYNQLPNVVIAIYSFLCQLPQCWEALSLAGQEIKLRASLESLHGRKKA